MSGRYERVNALDDDDIVSTPTATTPGSQPIPNSPPPSFHSRTSSSTLRNRGVQDPTLADAFDADDSDSDDEPDDRQRLVRQNSDLIQPASANHQPASSTDSSGANTPASSQAQAQAQATASRSNRIIGSGIQSDGVFTNLTAKPERGGSEKEEQPPTYEQAAADAAPPYWETTILAPGLGGLDEVYIDGMPVGSLFSFVWNAMISMSFQLVGFLLTYLLHSTHAAKNGSRAGLGITLIQYGFYMKGSAGTGDGSIGDGGGMGGNDGNGYASPPDPNAHDFDPNAVAGGGNGDGSSGGISDMASSEWVAYILMIVGWFILIRSVSDFLRARRHEQLVLQSPDRGLGIPIIAEGETSERVV
ncbi:Metal homeostatis protein BSD2 [Cytospora mali]|uniref:Metal homeostatis protein BSD2 n=1 Tax=Cytospora mali TaxID=578113 RepID=A0A194VGK2_CYTMA|nr:Metal homeostatis protein BSD2 [Valsa mali var. pyri (nom. inval.)]